MTRWWTLTIPVLIAACSGPGAAGLPPVAAVVDPAGPPAPGMAQTAFDSCTPGMPATGDEALPVSDVEVVVWPWGVEVVHLFLRSCCDDAVDVEAEILGNEVIVREVWTHLQCDCVCATPFRTVTQIGLDPGDYLFELDVLNGKELENVLFTSVEIAAEGPAEEKSE